MTIQAPVGPWTPDLPPYENIGSTEALNVTPAANSYRPFPSFSAASSALSARCQGAIFARKADGSGIVIAGDKNRLYLLTASSVADISRSGSAYTCPDDGRWAFVQFGPLVLAFNGHNYMQAHNIDTGTRFGDTTAAPLALHACVAGDFVMTGNQPEAGLSQRVQWSAINNAVDWAISQATQASYQDLPDGGQVMGLVGIEYGAVILQEFAIRRASYEGPPLIFRFDRLSDGLGCSLPGSIARFKDLIFFCDRSGFYVIQGGIQLVPIGAQLVDNTFWGLVDQSNLSRVSAAIDPVNSLYVIGFPDTSATNGNINHLFVYHWGLSRWAHVQPGNLDLIFSAVAGRGYTMEGLDSVSANLDTLPFSLDSGVWQGVARGLVGGFNTSHALGFFNGAPLAATVDTTEQNIIPGRKAFLRSARPLFDDAGTAAAVALGTRNRLNDTVSFGVPVMQNARGLCKFRCGANARYHRGRITVSAGANWKYIQGLTDIAASPMGQR